MNKQDVKFLTVDEFAKKIGVHPQTVRQWDKNGVLLPHHKILLFQFLQVLLNIA